MSNIIISVSIVVYAILLIILILNIEQKSKIIKYSFTLFIICLLILMFFANELIMDYLISLLIKYWYFPSFASIIGTILISMVIFIRNIYNDKLNDKKRIINYIFASYIFIGYIVFMLKNIDINSYNALYTGESLLCLRYLSRTFLLWIIVILIIKYFDYFTKKR